MTTRPVLPPGLIEHEILVVLAPLYGAAVKVLNQAVKRNRERFPEDFICDLKIARAGRGSTAASPAPPWRVETESMKNRGQLEGIPTADCTGTVTPSSAGGVGVGDRRHG